MHKVSMSLPGWATPNLATCQLNSHDAANASATKLSPQCRPCPHEAPLNLPSYGHSSHAVQPRTPNAAVRWRLGATKCCGKGLRKDTLADGRARPREGRAARDPVHIFTTACRAHGVRHLLDSDCEHVRLTYANLSLRMCIWVSAYDCPDGPDARPFVHNSRHNNQRPLHCGKHVAVREERRHNAARMQDLDLCL